ncbi:MAG: TIGR04086 family membrane protein [Clostridia bacterium]|nr:TIGR04086 family membrane protein [Clostridia bacterium]
MNTNLLLSVIKGIAVGIAITVLLLLLGTLIALRTADPDAVTAWIAHVVRLLGGFAAGFAASRFHREQGLLTGLLSGSVYALFLMIGAALGGNFRFFGVLLLCLAVAAAGAVGGILGLPGEKSNTAKRKAMLKRMGG